ncbi:MAG: hypothetical protein WKF93_01650 [Acidimicrobiales bacterium]
MIPPTVIPVRHGSDRRAPGTAAAVEGEVGLASGRPGRAAGIGVVVWAGLVATSVVVGARVVADRPDMAINAAPVVGRWDWHPSLGLLPAVVLGLAVVVAGPRLVARMSWGTVLVVAAVVAVLWPMLLAGADGLAAIGAPLGTRYEYLPVAADLDDPTAFLRDYVNTLGDQPTHVRGHPPGPVLALHALDRLGLGGEGWAAALVLAAWGAGAAAVLAAARAVAGIECARRAAPFVALVPGAVWAGTSMDALFGGVAAVGIALVVLGLVAPATSRRRADAVALAGGVVLGIALHLTYGAVPLLVIPAVVAWRWRRARPVVVAVAGVAAVTGAFVAGGFWWFDGLAATRLEYETGLARLRPYGYFTALGNPGALALAVGPAVAAGLAALAVTAWRRRWQPSDDRGRRRWIDAVPAIALLPGAAVVAVLAADLSGLSKGEVERIWLPFVPWLALAAGAVAVTARRASVFLGAQVVLAVALQAGLLSPW